MPKAHLKGDAGLYNEYLIAKELHMTHRRLLLELGPGEQAYWGAVFELESEHYSQMRADSERRARATSAAAERTAVPSRWRPQHSS